MFYPSKLIKTIIRDIRDTKNSTSISDGEDIVHAALEGHGTIGVKVNKSKVTKVGGGHNDIQLAPRNFKEFYRGECTNEILPSNLIHAAIIEELEYFASQV